MDIRPDFWCGKKVFLTGHTGFKGGWLTIYLQALGAQVTGFSLEPPTEPNLFSVARLGELLCEDIRGDVTDIAALQQAMCAAKPGRWSIPS